MTKKEANPDQKAAFKRLIDVLQEKNIKESDFYNSLGLENPTQTWNNWKSRGLPHKEVPRLAEKLELNLEWLAQGTGQKYKNIGVIFGQLEGITASINGTVGHRSPENIAKPDQNIDISKLMPIASPATQEILKTLQAGIKQGRLKEADIQLLDAIAKRIMDD